MIGQLVRTLMMCCMQKLEQLDKLRQLKCHYDTLQQQLQPWLTNKPDLNELHSLRKTLRSLKSKLRHRLADKQDLEEVCSALRCC